MLARDIDSCVAQPIADALPGYVTAFFEQDAELQSALRIFNAVASVGCLGPAALMSARKLLINRLKEACTGAAHVVSMELAHTTGAQSVNILQKCACCLSANFKRISQKQQVHGSVQELAEAFDVDQLAAALQFLHCTGQCSKREAFALGDRLLPLSVIAAALVPSAMPFCPRS